MTQDDKIGGSRDGSRLSEKGYYFGDLTEAERLTLLALLLELERERGEVAYLEIGVLGGGTVKFLRDNTTQVRFTGVDLFEDFTPDAANTHISATFKMADVQRSLGERARLIKGDSRLVLKQLREEGDRFDMIFIDGNHTYAAIREDLENSLPLLRDGGCVAFHNTSVHIFPDTKYIARDGGPWKVTQELRRRPEFFLEADVERVRIFRHR